VAIGRLLILPAVGFLPEVSLRATSKELDYVFAKQISGPEGPKTANYSSSKVGYLSGSSRRPTQRILGRGDYLSHTLLYQALVFKFLSL
jgi:hypothetical protein